MFRNKPFNIAFLISLSWHLFCMFFITIVFLPANFKMAKTSTVSFLGPILEKTVFEMMLDKRTQSRRTLYKQPMYFDTSFIGREEKGLNKLKFENVFLAGKKEELKESATALFGDFKFIPPFQQGGVNAGQEKAAQAPPQTKGQENFSIEGPLADRQILFKPALPLISKRIDKEQESFIVQLKFKALPDGTVDEVALLASSGYPDADITAINYIKGFRFSSSGTESNKPQWGRVRLNLKSK